MSAALILGGRANWILHHFQSPKWNPKVKIIQIDIEAEELHTNVTASVGMCGDLQAVCQQFVQHLREKHQSALPLKAIEAWRNQLSSKVSKAGSALAKLAASDKLPMSYHRTFQEIKQLLPEDHVFVSEGSLTVRVPPYG